MELDIVEEVAKAEAEAEELLKRSRARAKELEKEAEEAIRQFKQALEEEFKARAEELRLLRQKERHETETRLEEELTGAQIKLKESGEKRSEAAVRYILERLQPASRK
jgi:hypothetical protein